MNYELVLMTLAAALNTIAQNHYNHERRDARLNAVRLYIQRTLDTYTNAPLDERRALRQIHELAFPHDHLEDHNQVRSRVYLLIEIVARERKLLADGIDAQRGNSDDTNSGGNDLDMSIWGDFNV